MKKPAQALLEKFIRERNLKLIDERARVGIIEGWVSMSGNLIIALVKVLCGLFTGSISLLADAMHTISDIATSAVVLIGFGVSKKEADDQHPFGHGRVEYLAGLIIALMLIGAGVSFILTAYDRLMAGVVMEPSLIAIFLVLFTIIFKEFLCHFSIAAAKKIDSDTLLADAMHHRTDSLTTLAVLIAITGAYFNMGYLDSIFGFGVAAYVIYTGIKIAHNSINRLMGAAPSDETHAQILDSILNTKGVLSAHNLHIHDYGAHKSITVHIEVDGNLSMHEAHDIAHRVENNLREKNSCHCVVHLDPHNRENSPE